MTALRPTHAACSTGSRARGMLHTAEGDVATYARRLAARPDSALLAGQLKRAQHFRAHRRENLAAHLAACDICPAARR